MANTTGSIGKLEVRCPCGECFENADMYLEHKRRQSCKAHRDTNDINALTPRSHNVSGINPTRAPVSASSSKAIVCSCGKAFQTRRSLQQHARSCAIYKQQTDIRSASSSATRTVPTNSVLGSDSTLRPTDPTMKKVQCPCGQSFANEKTLYKHLRYSKTHNPVKTQSPSAANYKARGKAESTMTPVTETQTRATSNSPPLSPLPGTIPHSMLSQASLIRCTCGHAFETQRVLDLHKRDCLSHKQLEGTHSPGKKERVDSLVSSFASLSIMPTSRSATAEGARFSCQCGRRFATKDALVQHEQHAARHAWQPRAQERKSFKTAQPQYQANEEERELAALVARQYGTGAS